MITKLEIVITEAFDSFPSYPHHPIGLFVPLSKKWRGAVLNFCYTRYFIICHLLLLLVKKHQDNINILIIFRKELEV
jgi:hypothetical protein